MSSFLTAHHHILGYSEPDDGVEKYDKKRLLSCDKIERKVNKVTSKVKSSVIDLTIKSRGRPTT